jgi:hypothetical protein
MERRLSAFVDRVKEMGSFCQMLDTKEKPIMAVWGEAGLGKTSLFFRMVHECAQRKLRKAEVVWSDTRKHDYLAIMSKIRDDVGVDHFTAFTEKADSLISMPYEFNVNIENAAPINIGGGMKIDNSNVGDIALVKAVLPVSDMAAIEKSRMIKLTDLFLQSLTRAVESEPLVIFFDAIEKMSEDTYNWVRDELLTAVSGGRLENVCFVLCGRQKPEFGTDIQWIVEEAELQPLGLDDIAEYLEKRFRDEKLDMLLSKENCRFIARMLHKSTKGRPDEVAIEVETAIREQKREVARP